MKSVLFLSVSAVSQKQEKRPRNNQEQPRNGRQQPGNSRADAAGSWQADDTNPAQIDNATG